MKRENVVSLGEILTGEFLKPAGISEGRFALDLGVPATQVSKTINGDKKRRRVFRFDVFSFLIAVGLKN